MFPHTYWRERCIGAHTLWTISLYKKVRSRAFPLRLKYNTIYDNVCDQSKYIIIPFHFKVYYIVCWPKGRRNKLITNGTYLHVFHIQVAMHTIMYRHTANLKCSNDTLLNSNLKKQRFWKTWMILLVFFVFFSASGRRNLSFFSAPSPLQCMQPAGPCSVRPRDPVQLLLITRQILQLHFMQQRAARCATNLTQDFVSTPAQRRTTLGKGWDKVLCCWEYVCVSDRDTLAAVWEILMYIHRKILGWNKGNCYYFFIIITLIV